MSTSDYFSLKQDVLRLKMLMAVLVDAAKNEQFADAELLSHIQGLGKEENTRTDQMSGGARKPKRRPVARKSVKPVRKTTK